MELGQKARGLTGSCSIGKHVRTTRDTNQVGFGHRGCGPPVCVNCREPLRGGSVMHVSRPGERDQNIRIQQIRHQSSSGSRTISDVTGSASGTSAKVGKGDFQPVDGLPGGRSPRRASSETADPREMPFSWANARAEARTRSAMSNVVGITASLCHQSKGWVRSSPLDRWCRESDPVGAFR